MLRGIVGLSRVAAVVLLLTRVIAVTLLNSWSGVGVLRSQHKFHGDPGIEAIVLIKRDIAHSFASVENLQTDLAGILVLSRQLHHSHDTFHDLSSDNGLFRQSGG